MATDVWKRLRAWTGGFGRARRIASRRASSQRRATDHVGFSDGLQPRWPGGSKAVPALPPEAVGRGVGVGDGNGCVDAEGNGDEAAAGARHPASTLARMRPTSEPRPLVTRVALRRSADRPPRRPDRVRPWDASARGSLRGRLFAPSEGPEEPVDQSRSAATVRGVVEHPWRLRLAPVARRDPSVEALRLGELGA